jgi:hypothetical protein
MRHTIETAPRDGKFIIIEDDASGRYDVAHWSPSGEWVREDGEPSKVTPSRWHPVPSEKYHALGDEGASSVPAAAPVTVAPVEAQMAQVQAKRAPDGRRGFATSIAVTLVAAALIGMYLHAEVAAFLTRYPGLQNIFGEQIQLASQELRKPDLLAHQPQAEPDQARAQAAPQDVAQVQQAVETSVPEARQSLEGKQRSEALANELAEARRTIDGINLQLRAEAARAQSLEQEREKTAAFAQQATAARQELTANAEQYRGALEEERARAAALASELAAARREIEMQAALSRKSGDEAAQHRQTAESAIADLRQSLQQEREKTAALTQDASAARQAMTASAEQHRRALEEGRARAAALASELAGARREIETHAALLRKADDDAAQHRKMSESTIPEVQQSLQQERDRTEAMARDIESARRTTDGRVSVGRAADSQVIEVTRAAEAPVAERPVAAEAQDGPETARLMARARALLGQGNIGAARTVLERAAERGSAQASFMLAETYDPAILSAWGTYGTRGEATKAREFYAKAHAAGIQEAKTRFDALGQ